MSNDNCGTQRIDDMFVIGVQQKAIVYVALFRNGVPENPITALIYRSFCICKINI